MLLLSCVRAVFVDEAMKIRRLWRLGGLLLFIGAGGSVAHAQYARTLEGLVNRPTRNAPSETVGGRFTRSGTQPLESTRGANVSMFGQRPLPSRAGMNRYDYGQAADLTDVGVQSDLQRLWGPTYFDFLSRAMRNRSGEISSISGLNRAVSINLPLPGQPIGGLPALSACAYTPRPATNRFEDLLGLQPAEPEQTLRMAPSLAERLDLRSDEAAVRAAAEGAALFKQGTREAADPQTGEYRECPECPAALGHAVQVLRMANDLDQAAGLPSLLVVHAALAQERPLAAASALLKALHREPNLLAGRGRTLDPYFGDVERDGQRSALLTAQMRRFARLGEFNTTSPVAFALQAYCAWRLGDASSVRASLSKLDELLPGVDEAEAAEFHGLATALRDALP
jgi:hypothetical protein